jgi:hypothetical protein
MGLVKSESVTMELDGSGLGEEIFEGEEIMVAG